MGGAACARCGWWGRRAAHPWKGGTRPLVVEPPVWLGRCSTTPSGRSRLLRTPAPGAAPAHSIRSRSPRPAPPHPARPPTSLAPRSPSPADSLIFLLIDEVESLTAARRSAVSGNEPSDAVRVVNAVLTAIDALRARPNVLLLATSNVSEAIDVAFVDRADLKCYIGLPSPAARYEIMASTVAELMRVGVVTPAVQLLPVREAVALAAAAGSAAAATAVAQPPNAAAVTTATGVKGEEPRWAAAAPLASADGIEGSIANGSAAAATAALSAALYRVAARAEGLSGRSLRKLPLQAHALFVTSVASGRVSPADFLVAMDKAVSHELKARRDFASDAHARDGT